MTTWAIYERETGILVSSTQDEKGLATPAEYEARGHVVASIPDEEAQGVWDRTLLRYVPRPAVAVGLTRYQFKVRLTPQERITIRLAAREGDLMAEDILDLLNTAEEIVITDEQVQMAIGYLVVAGFLAPSRGEEVLAP